MAVYTEVPEDALNAFLDGYDIGTPRSFKGIAEGIENSNYLLRTTQGSYILTLYEKRTSGEELPFFLNLMEHLAAAQIPCPVPIKDRRDEALHELCGKPAALVSFLDGLSPRRISAEHCRILGQGVGHFHAAGLDFTEQRPNALGVESWRSLYGRCGETAEQLLPGLHDEILVELDFLEANWPSNLPTGIIHGDLFPDNVFFTDGRLSGIIDLYFACSDILAYDIAICINAWCFEDDGGFDADKAREMLNGYALARSLSKAERLALPILARGAALRFFLTRLYDWNHTPDAPLTRRKDPIEYWAKIRFHREYFNVHNSFTDLE